jgi:hypothetical protein
VRLLLDTHTLAVFSEDNPCYSSCELTAFPEELAITWSGMYQPRNSSAYLVSGMMSALKDCRRHPPLSQIELSLASLSSWRESKMKAFKGV